MCLGVRRSPLTRWPRRPSECSGAEAASHRNRSMHAWPSILGGWDSIMSYTVDRYIMPPIPAD